MIALVLLLLASGLLFHAAASLGMIRLPDFFTRLHALSKAETVGTMLTLAAVALWEGASLTSLKVGFVAVFFFLGNPGAAHAVARAALRAGLPPWRAGQEPS